jgi:hypothetical protein
MLHCASIIFSNAIVCLAYSKDDSYIKKNKVIGICITRAEPTYSVPSKQPTMNKEIRKTKKYRRAK